MNIQQLRYLSEVASQGLSGTFSLLLAVSELNSVIAVVFDSFNLRHYEWTRFDERARDISRPE